jgi:hypothetical protein
MKVLFPISIGLLVAGCAGRTQRNGFKNNKIMKSIIQKIIIFCWDGKLTEFCPREDDFPGSLISAIPNKTRMKNVFMTYSIRLAGLIFVLIAWTAVANPLMGATTPTKHFLILDIGY